MAEFEPDDPTYPTLDYCGYAPPPQTIGAPMPTAPPPEWQPPPAPARIRSTRFSTRRALLSTAVLAALIGAAVGAITVALSDGNDHGGNAGLTFGSQTAPAATVDGSVSAAAARIGPSVVTINVTTSQGEDTGSGVVIRADGYILTNNHVVDAAGTAGTITVTLSDGRRASGTVVGADAPDDLAVVKIGISGLQAAAFASSANLVVGQTVVAVGAPLGLSDTVTAGIVSNTARPVQTGTSTSGQDTAAFDAVQTDAAINPGNSGGPLVNLAGEVVGINAAIASDPSQGGLQVPGQSSQAGNIGIGFAIPSNEASRIAGQLISTGRATHAVLGVSVKEATATTSASSPVGAVIVAVTAGGPAAGAGIEVGDVVTTLAGQLIPDGSSLVAATRSHAPGDTVTATIVRGTASHRVTVRLGSS